MVYIKILGKSDPNCKRMEDETRTALDTAGILYDLKRVTNPDEIARYEVMTTPALVFNERVVAIGRIPPRARIVELAREVETTAL